MFLHCSSKRSLYFTRLSNFYHPQAGTPHWAGTPPGRYTPRQVHPRACTPLTTVTAADGTHPTVMLSRLLIYLYFIYFDSF